MKILICLLTLLAGTLQASAAPLSFGPLGNIVVRGRQQEPRMVAVILSDATGWGEVEEEMSRTAGDAGALVLGVDTRLYFERVEKKGYEPDVSNELASMSTYAQKTLGLRRLTAPLLIGHGAGGGVVYASLVQAPAGTFLGGISLGFRPALALSHPFGTGRGLAWDRAGDSIRYRANTRFPLPWSILQAEHDSEFTADEARGFTAGMRGVTVQALPAAGYSEPASWNAALKRTLTSMVPADGQEKAGRDPDVEGLPLVEVPPGEPASDTLAVFVSGDGGWAGIDKDIAAILAGRGIGVVGVDSLRYFWTRRSPQEAGTDLGRIMGHYLEAWHKKRVVLIGFSLGADALPPMINNLAPELKKTIRQISLLAPSRFVELEFHVSDWIHDNEAAQDIALLPEVRRLPQVPLLCLYGQEETESLCGDLDPQEATVTALPGSHHFKGDYAGVARQILDELNRR